MKLTTFAKFAVGTSASVLALMVAVPVASAWSPSKVIVPGTGQAAQSTWPTTPGAALRPAH